MDIVSIPHACNIGDEKGNCRNVFLSGKLHAKGHDYEMILPSFDHAEKKQRVYENNVYHGKNYKAVILPTSSYFKSISIKRIFSFMIFSSKLKKYLHKRKRPDLLFCSVPTISAAKKVAKFAKKEKIPLILDVRDLWPEAFQMLISTPFVMDLLLFKMKRDVNFIYKAAEIGRAHV